MNRFDGKVAVITGGASGIGLALATALGAEGARVLLADVEQARLDEAEAKLQEAGIDVRAKRTDVSDRQQLDALADYAWDACGRVDLLFNNAGVAPFGPVHEAASADWDWALDVNLRGCIHGVQAFVPRMLSQGGSGHVLFTASFAGLVANRSLGVYNVSKAAVVSLAESLRKDIKGSGIGVSVLCPMRVTSDIDNSSRNRPSGSANTSPADGWEEKSAGLEGRELPAEQVASLVLDGILRNDAFIHTHAEAAAFLERRQAQLASTLKYAL